MGLRELKKQRTRKSISDLATMLFIERGYNEVTTAEIAEMAEVSVPTLFKYFPTKESLVFDKDSETENWLVETVLNRKKNQSILDALFDARIEKINALPTGHQDHYKKFMSLVERTPELNIYAKQMWMRHEKTLAEVIIKEAKTKLSILKAESIARFILDCFHRTLSSSNPKDDLGELFEIIKNGWSE